MVWDYSDLYTALYLICVILFHFVLLGLGQSTETRAPKWPKREFRTFKSPLFIMLSAVIYTVWRSGWTWIWMLTLGQFINHLTLMLTFFDAPSPLCYALMHKARGGHTFCVAGWAELLPQKIWRAQKFVQKSLAGKLQPYNNLIETHNCASLTLNMPLITIITSNHTKCSSSFCNCVLFYQVLQNS